MIDFVSFFSEIAKDLIPSSDQSTAVRFLRLGVLIALFYLLISTTNIFDKFGIQLNRNPVLTHSDFLESQQRTWLILSRLRHEDDSVRAVFFLSLFDKRTKNFVESDLPPQMTELNIWQWEIPVRNISSIDSIKEVLNLRKEEIEDSVRDAKGCITEIIDADFLANFKRTIPNFISTHMAFCPVYTSTNTRLIGMTMILFRVKPPYQALEYQERLKDATSYVRKYFDRFDTKYIFIYD